MENILEYIIYFLLVFIIVFLGDYLIIKKPIYDSLNNKQKRNKKKDKLRDIFELNYIITKFNLDKKKMPIKKCLLHFTLINALIISLTVTILSMLDIFVGWKFLIGFILLFGLIYAIYELYGKMCIKKGWKK